MLTHDVLCVCPWLPRRFCDSERRKVGEVVSASVRRASSSEETLEIRALLGRNNVDHVYLSCYGGSRDRMRYITCRK